MQTAEARRNLLVSDMRGRLSKHAHRRSSRLSGFDYSSPGAYFVTLVTYKRKELFGEIHDGRLQLSPLGKIARDEWICSITIRSEIRLFKDEFVVMPNHIHAIVWIVGADGVRPRNDTLPKLGASLAPLQNRLPKSLSSFIAGYKSVVTSRAKHKLHLTSIWQRNYYDHIIRNENDLMNIWEYIDTNPQRWQDDQLHPSKKTEF